MVGLFKLPVVVGQLVAGMLVGPHCLSLVKQPVQVASLGQLGSAFLLFDLGLHFSVSKISKARRAALWCGCIGPLCFVVFFLYGALRDGTPLAEAVVLGYFAMTSSTAICSQDIGARRAAETHESEVLMGVLILQDLLLSLVLASLPAFSPNLSSLGFFTMASNVARPILSVALFTSLTLAFSVAIPSVSHYLHMNVSHEIFLISHLGWVLFFGRVAEHLSLSLELGTFTAGVICTRIADHVQSDIVTSLSTIRDFCASLFFASIGLIIDPLLLWDNLTQILILCAIVATIKGTVFSSCMLLARYDFWTSLRIGLILAQLGEFNFVILERATALGLLNRKVYLLLLSTTGINLMIAPIFVKCITKLPQGVNVHVPPHGASGGLPLTRTRSGPVASLFAKVATALFSTAEQYAPVTAAARRRDSPAEDGSRSEAGGRVGGGGSQEDHTITNRMNLMSTDNEQAGVQLMTIGRETTT